MQAGTAIRAAERQGGFAAAHRERRKHMANMVTGCRIVCSILLLFVPAFSRRFVLLYLACGFTDMIDGTIARKTNTAGYSRLQFSILSHRNGWFVNIFFFIR